MNSKVGNETILVTGAAGFIGAALVKALLTLDFKVIGIDNLNDYYSTSLKRSRLTEIEKVSTINGEWFFHEIHIEDDKVLQDIINRYKPQVFVHLAAQAGVRYSITNPAAYIQSNLVGFANVLEGCRQNKIPHLIYASSSSVYGGNKNLPFYEEQAVNHPVSLYAATKKSNELMAHTYSHLYDLPTTGLRFFTVYGPWGRPDMAPMIFARSILNNEPIQVFNHGNMQRDFTYIDDIVNGIYSIITKPSKNFIPYNVFNIGNGSPKKLLDYLKIIEKNLRKKAKIKNLPLQLGDIKKTHSNISALNKYSNNNSSTSIEKGISEFINWYREYYKK